MLLKEIKSTQIGHTKTSLSVLSLASLPSQRIWAHQPCIEFVTLLRGWVYWYDKRFRPSLLLTCLGLLAIEKKEDIDIAHWEAVNIGKGVRSFDQQNKTEQTFKKSDEYVFLKELLIMIDCAFLWWWNSFISLFMV